MVSQVRQEEDTNEIHYRANKTRNYQSDDEGHLLHYVVSNQTSLCLNDYRRENL